MEIQQLLGTRADIFPIVTDMPKKKSKAKKKGKSKMPKNVLEYFKLRSSGMSKEKAKKQAGL